VNGADALNVYLNHPGEIDVVFTDMMMPVMDGPALIGALRRQDPCVKILAASGLNTTADTIRAAGEGVHHFISKPYLPRDLAMAIRSLLDEKV
jgi:CheY-like chemotaxis protein